MALVDPSKLRLRFNFRRTLQTYSSGMARQREKVEDEQATLDKMKKEVVGFFTSHVFNPLGIAADAYGIEVGFTRMPVGEYPELKVTITVNSADDCERVSAKLQEWKLSHSKPRKKDGIYHMRVLFEDYLDHNEAREPKPIR